MTWQPADECSPCWIVPDVLSSSSSTRMNNAGGVNGRRDSSELDGMRIRPLQHLRRQVRFPRRLPHPTNSVGTLSSVPAIVRT